MGAIQFINRQFVYRVQNRNGKGPYTSDFLNDGNSEWVKTHPSPVTDEGIKRFPKYTEYCGFDSLDDLLNWFKIDTLIKLTRHGYQICMVEANVTAKGQFQVLFERIPGEPLFCKIFQPCEVIADEQLIA
jgi:hypothetical protein